MQNVRYVPILRTRRNERLAVSDLSGHVRNLTAPLFDISAPDDDKGERLAIAYVERNIDLLSRKLSGYPQLLVDSSILPAGMRLSDDVHPLFVACSKLIDTGSRVIPVTGLARDQAHWEAAIEVAALNDNKQICLRLDVDDLRLPSDTVTEVKELKNSVLADYEIIVLFDCESVFGKEITPFVDGILDLNRKLVGLTSNPVIVAGCGMPTSIRDVAAISESAYVSRLEVGIWSEVKKLDASAKRIILGDYTTISPQYEMLDPKITNRVTAAKIIYALSGQWFVIRGTRLFIDGNDQYFDLASEVTALPEFSGPEYSAGDKHIQSKSDRIGNPGMPGSWVRPSVNHHITLTALETTK